MLTKLYIQNYAIIEELEINFSSKLNIITGETGAGKSIIVGALGLILGDRADSTVLVKKNSKCIVEGFFLVKGNRAVEKFLLENDLDVGDELVLRREIAVNGKSRAFINDTPVTLAVLNNLSSQLVDLHRQFDTQDVGESAFQREVLDALAGNEGKLQQYQEAYRSWQQAKNKYEELQEQKTQLAKEKDYNQFQYDELAAAGFKVNELEESASSLQLMEHAEGIKTTLSKIYFELSESENPIAQQLKSLLNSAHPFREMHTALPEVMERLKSSQIELQDIAEDIDRINQQINYDPEAIENLNQRIDSGYKLLKKHGVQTTAELLAIQKELEEKLQSVLNIDEALQTQEKETRTLLDAAITYATKISAARQKQVKPLESNVNKLLAQVGMPNAQLKVAIHTTELSVSGTDSIDFLFDANKSNQFLPVRKVASGGELSRLMLCIKSLVAQSINLPALIFDEIDTGISGEAARQVGIIMKDLACRLQVICITHQPQIAGKADAHYFVYKEIVKNEVKTNIRLLNTDERITTIAQMLSGEKPTAAALENAREMVGN